MSLINDVLRDLERRGAAEIPRRAMPRTPRAGQPRRWLWWLAAAVMAGALLHWVAAGLGPEPQPDRIVAEAPAGPGLAPTGDPLPPLLQPVPRVAAGDDGAPPGGRDAVTEDHTQSAPPPASPAPAQATPQAAAERLAAADTDATPEVDSPSASGPARPEPAVESAPAGTPPAAAPGRDAGTASRKAPAAVEPNIVIRRSGTASAGGEAGFAAAHRALARGNTGLAASRLQQLLEADPGHVEGRLLLARVHMEDGRPRSAAAVLEEGLERDPGESRLAYLLGRLLLEQGRVANARQVLEAHAPPLDEHADYHLLLAATHRQAGDHGRAAEAYRELTETHPNLGAAWVGLGVSLESDGRNQAARAAYNQALRGDDRRAAAFARQRLAVMPTSPEPGQDESEVP